VDHRATEGQMALPGCHRRETVLQARKGLQNCQGTRHNVAQLKNMPLPPDTDVVLNPEPYPQAFGPNAAAVRQRLDVMHHLTQEVY